MPSRVHRQRGICYDCGRDVALATDGSLYEHRTPSGQPCRALRHAGGCPCVWCKRRRAQTKAAAGFKGQEH